jgi:hypothetical protein
MFSSYGVVKYDPRHPRSTFKPWWVILQCDPEIVRYYQHIFYKLYFKKLQTAVWNSHISLVRGEKPKITDAWKKFDGKIVEFNYEYNGVFLGNGKHYYLKCWSKEFENIRTSLGLHPKPVINYHISVGSIFMG